MSELLQTGQHPDADQMSAFVEHALPAHEQEWMLAHLAVCPDCRGVVAVSMPPVAELPTAQPVPARTPWFLGWNLVWPVTAAAFASFLLIAVLTRKVGGNAPPPQIAEAHPPQKPAAPGGVTTTQPGLPPARAASPSPTAQDRSISAAQGAKPGAGKPPAEPKAEDQGVAGLARNDLPLNGRNVQSLPPPAGAAPARGVAGMAGLGSASGSGLAPRTQMSGGGLHVQQQAAGSAGLPAAPPAAVAMAGLAAAPPVASPAPAPAPLPTVVARAGSGSAPAQVASRGAAANAVTVDAFSDDVRAVKPASNASSAVISGESLGTLAMAGKVALHPLPSGLPALSVATAGETMLALDSGNALFFSGDAGAHWKRVRAAWEGRTVKVALAAPPASPAEQPVAVNRSAFGGGLQARMSAASATAATAQSAAGSGATLTGQVTDPTGAAIPGAAVTVTNKATAATVTVKADAAGRYFTGGLAAGAYRIDATARGFARQELNLTLAALQQGRADLKLQVGQMSETVTVTSPPPQIETENSSLSAEVLESKRKKDAPPVFAITTDAGKRWVSADGRNWKRE